MENSLVRSQTCVQRLPNTDRKDFGGSGSRLTNGVRHVSNLPGRAGSSLRIPKRRSMPACVDSPTNSMIRKIGEVLSCDMAWDAFKNEEYTDSSPHIHSSSRILLHPSAEIQKASDDRVIQWDMIAEIVSFVNEELKCPVCLCSPMVPRMTKCGHIYCWPCAIKYIKFENSTCFKKCPVCSGLINLLDLKRVAIFQKDNLQIGSIIELVLVKRNSDCCSAEFSRTKSPGGDIDFSFAQKLTWNNMRTMIQEDFDALFAYKVVCDGDADGESISEVETALDYLCEELRLLEQNAVYLSQLETSTCAIDKESDPISTIYFYQSSDGQPVFLDGLMWNCMVTEYGNIESLPSPITVTISSIKHCKMTTANRKRWRYLSHLPLGYSFKLIEVDLYPSLISEDTMNQYSASLRCRSIKKEHRRLEDIRLTKLKEAAENRIPTIPEGFVLSPHVSLTERQRLPLDSDFVPLCSAPQVEPKATCSSVSFAEVTKSGALSVVGQNRVANFRRGPPPPTRPVFDPKHELWPTLGSLEESGHPVVVETSNESFESRIVAHVPGDAIESFDATEVERSVKRNRRRRRGRIKDISSDMSILCSVPP